MKMEKRKICVVIGSRANYSSIKSAMEAIKRHPELELQLIVGASALLERFGSVVDLIKKDGFKPDITFNMMIEGETPTTMAKSTGLGLLELPTLFESLKPDIVVTVGDRFETMSTAIAAAYMNIPIAHTMGGEVSGTIDESIRHAVTKLSHIHFAANEEAKERIIKLGENPRMVFNVGCPRMDLIKSVLNNRKIKLDNKIYTMCKGVGPKIDLQRPFLLVSQHPVTTEYQQAREQIETTLAVLDELKMNTIMLWPNIDAGSDLISKSIRTFRERRNPQYIHFFKNLPINIYVKMMENCTCLIGNSSSGIREGAFIGTPVVNIGTRQNCRRRGKNVIDVGYDKGKIIKAIETQIKCKKYKSEPLYGNGSAGEKLADILSKIEVNVQKKMTY